MNNLIKVQQFTSGECRMPKSMKRKKKIASMGEFLLSECLELSYFQNLSANFKISFIDCILQPDRHMK